MRRLILLALFCALQGSGKTRVMAFAAAKIRAELELDAPTILVLDRLDHIEQVHFEFASVGIPGLVAGTAMSCGVDRSR